MCETRATLWLQYKDLLVKMGNCSGSSACLTFESPGYLIGIFTHLKMFHADAIHNFKWVKNIQIWLDRAQ